MKKDISFPPVENVHVAVVRTLDVQNNVVWEVYVINLNDRPIHNVLIRSKGYGTNNGEQQQTSTLRHHFIELGPQEHALIEPIDPSVFHLYNEYWLSYFIDNQIYDKKFIFVPETILEKNLVFIPALKKEGILHR